MNGAKTRTRVISLRSLYESKPSTLTSSIASNNCEACGDARIAKTVDNIYLRNLSTIENDNCTYEGRALHQ